MKLSQEQLEWIVSEVIRRLKSQNENGEASILTTRLSISDRLVTTETLWQKLEGVTHVDVVANAVVTPAVVDLLRDRQIALVRGGIK